MRLAHDSPSFTPVHSQIRAIGPQDLHLWKGRGPLDFLLILGAEAFKLLLLFQGEHWQLEGRRMFSAESMAEIPALDQLPAQPSLQEATA